MKRLAFIISICICLLSCEKNIDFVPRDSTPSVVIDAFIENGRPPEVRLSRSMNYFTKLTPELLSSSFIHDAKVVMSNGTRTHELKEYMRELTTGYKIYYYSIDTARFQYWFQGRAGKRI